MKNTLLNIYNLGQLWKLAGTASKGFKEHSNYSLSTVKNSEWPNRIWTNNALSQDTIQDIKSEMNRNKHITFSYFNDLRREPKLIHNGGFKLKSIQYGMSLPLHSKFKIEKNLILKKVNDKANAVLWSQAFHNAFGYKISAETISKTSDTINYYLIMNKDILVGTIILLATNKTLGIHSLGIIPSERKKGYGKEIIHTVLNRAIDESYDLATLQASKMAKNMYSNMGFSLDFLMENYSLKP